jgi:ATP/ADP translocase
LPPYLLPLFLLSLLTKPTVDKAKKYYPLFDLGANVVLIFFGQSVHFVASLCAKLPPGIDPWGMSLKYLTTKTTPQANPTRAWSPIPSHGK